MIEQAIPILIVVILSACALVACCGALAVCLTLWDDFIKR